MNDRFMEIFMEIHQDMPRQGPGDKASTLKALALLDDLPDTPEILDIGCGPGMQNIDLALAATGRITAVDSHQPYLDQLAEKAVELGLEHRIHPVNGDMNALDYPPGSFDLIWSEGAIYITGFDNGLRNWKPFLKKGGYLAVTEMSWLRDGPPTKLAEFWNVGYPQMRDIKGNIQAVKDAGYEMTGHFVLSENSWWDNYYRPLEKRLIVLREKYAGDPEAAEAFAAEEKEMDLYRRYPDYAGYVFYAARAGM